MWTLLKKMIFMLPSVQMDVFARNQIPFVSFFNHFVYSFCLFKLECHDLDILSIPPDWSTNLERIIIKNATLNTIKKNAFRKFHSLEELSIEGCANLDVIDKFAFKGLQKLK